MVEPEHIKKEEEEPIQRAMCVACDMGIIGAHTCDHCDGTGSLLVVRISNGIRFHYPNTQAGYKRAIGRIAKDNQRAYRD